MIGCSENKAIVQILCCMCNELNSLPLMYVCGATYISDAVFCASSLLHCATSEILCCTCNKSNSLVHVQRVGNMVPTGDCPVCDRALCAHRPVCSTLVVDLIHATPPSSEPTSTRGGISYSTHSSHCDTS